jgi:hypothetical protein
MQSPFFRWISGNRSGNPVGAADGGIPLRGPIGYTFAERAASGSRSCRAVFGSYGTVHCVGSDGKDPMSQFSNTFYELARQRQMSIDYLAEFTRLDPAFIRRLMTGQKKPSHATTIKLALALVSDKERYRREREAMPNTLATLVDALLADAAVDSVTRVAR